MYKGYRLKINGTVLENQFIVSDSWSCTYHERRKLEEYNDAYGTAHINNSPHERTSISFKLAERNVVNNLLLMPLFAARDHVSVEYYVDETGEYATGTFGLKDLKLETKYVDDETIWYKETQIEYEEY